MSLRAACGACLAIFSSSALAARSPKSVFEHREPRVDHEQQAPAEDREDRPEADRRRRRRASACTSWSFSGDPPPMSTQIATRNALTATKMHDVLDRASARAKHHERAAWRQATRPPQHRETQREETAMPSPEFENLVQMFQAQRTDATPSIPELRTGFDMLGQMMPIADGVADRRDDARRAARPTASTTPDADDRPRPALPARRWLLHRDPCVASPDRVRRSRRRRGITVLLPEYRLAPEAPFPAAVDDARAVYEALLDTLRAGADRRRRRVRRRRSHRRAAREPARRRPSAARRLPPSSRRGATSPRSASVSDVALATDFLTPEVLVVFADELRRERERPHRCRCARPGPPTSPGSRRCSSSPAATRSCCDQDERLAARAKECGVDVTLEVEPDMFHAWHAVHRAPGGAGHDRAHRGVLPRAHAGSGVGRYATSRAARTRRSARG